MVEPLSDGDTRRFDTSETLAFAVVARLMRSIPEDLDGLYDPYRTFVDTRTKAFQLLELYEKWLLEEFRERIKPQIN